MRTVAPPCVLQILFWYLLVLLTRDLIRDECKSQRKGQVKDNKVVWNADRGHKSRGILAHRQQVTQLMSTSMWTKDEC
jgi:hypothetical protein